MDNYHFGPFRDRLKGVGPFHCHACIPNNEYIACGGFDHSVKLFGYNEYKKKHGLNWISGSRKLFYEPTMSSEPKGVHENNTLLLFSKNKYENKNTRIVNDTYILLTKIDEKEVKNHNI